MNKKRIKYHKPKLNTFGRIQDITKKINGPGDGPSLMRS